ncbi:MAG TPA: hypothetical protein VKV26_08805 [Dehalococcoidia bacterium]|nr:hypothetical protein [Dehalococcoidia bacterium]
MNVFAPRRRPSRPLAALALLLALLVGGFAVGAPRPALAWLASGTFFANGSGQGTGGATTITGPQANISISLAGAKPNASYAIFTCLPLTGGDFSCAGRNLPPAMQQVQIAPKALAPVVLTLVQQGMLNTDDFGNASLTLSPVSVLLPDLPRSIYNAVHLINTTDATDSYTALDIQSPVQPIAGVNAFTPAFISTAIGVPVFVLAQFPGYVFPVAITALGGVPFVPVIIVPPTVFGGVPFSTTVGLCPGTGRAPVARPGLNGEIDLFC